MSSPTTPEELLDLRLLPAWVNEPVRPDSYAHFEGGDYLPDERGARRPPQHRRERERRGPPSRGPRGPESRQERSRQPRSERTGPAHRDKKGRGRDNRHKPPPPVRPLPVTVHFIPHLPALDGVIAQIKSGLVAYSVFALARLFLEKPERYDV